MDDQLFQRIFRVNPAKCFPFLQRLYADTCLDRDRKGTLVKDFLQKGVQKVRHCKEPGTTLLGSHGAGRTAEIQIYFPVAAIRKLAGNREKSICLVSQNLWHNIQLIVVFWGNIVLVFIVQLLITEKWSEILINASIIVLQSIPVYKCGDPLHGCKI